MTADDLRRQVSAIWLFHGATIERALTLADSHMELIESVAEPEDRAAAGEERAKVSAALEAFRALGEGLQK